MKNLWAWAFAVSLLSGAPVQAGTGLDFHGFEHAYAGHGAPDQGYAAVRDAVPVGADARGSVALLRQAGAHCGAAREGQVACFYRERIAVNDVVDTYATWDVQLNLRGDKVAEVNVERSVDQR